MSHLKPTIRLGDRELQNHILLSFSYLEDLPIRLPGDGLGKNSTMGEV
jgi:hypothetical protein